jgi:putative ABC transport system permease protein
MPSLAPDIRYAVRLLLTRPGFAAVAIFTLAIGIGATTAIFTVVNAVLFRPLPFPRPDRLVETSRSDFGVRLRGQTSRSDFEVRLWGQTLGSDFGVRL